MDAVFAFDVFVDGLLKAEQYLQWSEDIMKKTVEKLTTVKAYTDEKMAQAKAIARGKSPEFEAFRKTARGMALGQCKKLCVLSAVAGPTACTTCFRAAEALV